MSLLLCRVASFTFFPLLRRVVDSRLQVLPASSAPPSVRSPAPTAPPVASRALPVHLTAPLAPLASSLRPRARVATAPLGGPLSSVATAMTAPRGITQEPWAAPAVTRAPRACTPRAQGPHPASRAQPVKRETSASSPRAVTAPTAARRIWARSRAAPVQPATSALRATPAALSAPWGGTRCPARRRASPAPWAHTRARVPPPPARAALLGA